MGYELEVEEDRAKDIWLTRPIQSAVDGKMAIVETFKRTPLQLFNLPQHFVIPLFQRPYVWKRGHQRTDSSRRISRVAVQYAQICLRTGDGCVVTSIHTCSPV